MAAQLLSKNLLALKKRLEEIGLTIPDDHCFERTRSIPWHGEWSWSVRATSMQTGKVYMLGSQCRLSDIAKKKSSLHFSWEGNLTATSMLILTTA